MDASQKEEGGGRGVLRMEQCPRSVRDRSVKVGVICLGGGGGLTISGTQRRYLSTVLTGTHHHSNLMDDFRPEFSLIPHVLFVFLKVDRID